MELMPIDTESFEKMRTAKEPMLCVERGTRKFVAGLAERYDGESAGTEGLRP